MARLPRSRAYGGARLLCGFLLTLAATLVVLVPSAGAQLAPDDSAGTATPTFPVLLSAYVDPSLLPADPLVVTDAALATAGAADATLALVDDPNMLIVDDDGAQCPNAQVRTQAGLQLAVQAAAPGSRIRVCPGTYAPVTIDKPGLVVQAPRQQGIATQCQAAIVADPTQEAIVTGTDPAGLVQIVAPGVVFEGLTVQGNTAGAGISTSSAASGYELAFDIVQHNAYGVDLNSDGAALTDVDHNCFRDNPQFKAGSLAIQSSSGLANTTISQNTFIGDDQASVASFLPVANVTVTHNDLIDDSTVFFNGGSNVVVSYDTWIRPIGASVIINNVAGLDVGFNHIDGQNTEPSQGIFLSCATPMSAVVESNKIENLNSAVGALGTAVGVNAPGVEVRQNWIQFNKGSGIRLGARSDGDTIRGNLLVGNGLVGGDRTDGIRVNSGAVGNLIDNNRLGAPPSSADGPVRENHDHDCHDDNPFGTNTWLHDVGYTENQPGLCVRTS